MRNNRVNPCWAFLKLSQYYPYTNPFGICSTLKENKSKLGKTRLFNLALHRKSVNKNTIYNRTTEFFLSCIDFN